MDKIREHISRFLVGVGLALAVVSIIVGGLSFPNWMDVTVHVAFGLAIGAVVVGMGLGLEAVLTMAQNSRQVRADMRVQTEAMVRLAGALELAKSNER